MKGTGGYPEKQYCIKTSTGWVENQRNVKTAFANANTAQQQ